jgi:hypothetical protein
MSPSGRASRELTLGPWQALPDEIVNWSVRDEGRTADGRDV